jgi:membrane protease YdiL (CAAX protease family)
MPSVPPPQASSTPPTPAAPQRRDDEPPWAVWTAPVGVLLGLGVGIFASLFVGIVAQTGGSSLSHPTPAVSLSADLVFDLSFVGAALYLASTAGRISPADFGFRRVALKLGVAAVVIGGVGYYVITALYASLVKLHGTDKLPSELGVSKSTAALIGAAVFVCVMAPMCEEFFFRGFIFGALRRMRVRVGDREIGTWLAAIITGIFFGAVHAGSASSQYLIPLAFLGFVLCLVRWWTRSLYPCMALHSLNNSLALGINELHWNAVEILALMAGSLVVIGAITLPLSRGPVPPAGVAPGPSTGVSGI